MKLRILLISVLVLLVLALCSCSSINAIIKSNTPDGLRQYDHIALNASDAVDQALIY